KSSSPSEFVKTYPADFSKVNRTGLQSTTFPGSLICATLPKGDFSLTESTGGSFIRMFGSQYFCFGECSYDLYCAHTLSKSPISRLHISAKKSRISNNSSMSDESRPSFPPKKIGRQHTS